MNKYLLEYEIRRHHLTIAEIAKKIGMGRTTFWKKCNGHSEFKQSEIAALIKCLDLENPSEIFFADEVS